MSKSNCKQKNCMKLSHKVRNTGKHDFHRFSSSSSSSFENTNLTNHSSNELEILYVSRFPSDLMHRHFYFLKK